MAKIVVKNLKYKYPATTKLALDDISFEIGQGEVVGIIGQNLSGKSTLCQALVGLVPHFYRGGYGGTVVVDGLVVGETEIGEMSKKVGLVFQNPFTQVTGSKMTVFEEVAFGLENMGMPPGEMKQRTADALHLLDIYKLKDKNPFDLSGGQMQRMAIAGVIAMQPEVIVLDEPTSQLDPQGAHEVFQAIRSLSAAGMTVVMAEHNMERLAAFCDKMIVLKEGRLMAFDSPERIFSGNPMQEWGIPAPVYTRICKQLSVKAKDSSYPPITMEQACVALGELFTQNTKPVGDRG